VHTHFMLFHFRHFFSLFFCPRSWIMNMVAGRRWFFTSYLDIYYLGLVLHHFLSFVSKLPFFLFLFFFLLWFGGVIERVLSAAQILASWTSSASLVFHSLLMRMVSFLLKVLLVLAFWFVQPQGFHCWGFSPICLRFGTDMRGLNPRMLSCWIWSTWAVWILE